MRVGSLCTGYGGLDLAIGGETVFVSEIDRHAITVLEARFPNVPNIGDLTELDGADLPEVDVLTAGFPCQPVSQAGNRRGTDDERWLWDDIERILGEMGRPPGVVFLENVRGLLSANGGDAMARVVEGLAGLGYVGSYRLIAASEVGACHRRARVFIAATHSAHDGLERGRPSRRRGDGPEDLGVAASHSDSGRLEGGEEQNSEPGEWSDGEGGGYAHRSDPFGPYWCPAPTDADGPRLEGRGHVSESRKETASEQQPAGYSRRSDLFGPYWPAVERWERVIGRPAPAPTDANSERRREDTGSPHGDETTDEGWATSDDHELGGVGPQRDESGGPRLSPRFVEWMMGLPDGWVTDCAIPRTAQLKILGNGVVPQQAAHAWNLMNDRN